MRKRSRYRPRALLANPLAALCTATPVERDAQMLALYSTLDTMARGGRAGMAEWRTVSDAINVVEALALHRGQLDAAEVLPAVHAAIEAMVPIGNEYLAGRSPVLAAGQRAALAAVLDIYAQCIEGHTQLDMARAYVETQRRLALARTPSGPGVYNL